MLGLHDVGLRMGISGFVMFLFMDSGTSKFPSIRICDFWVFVDWHVCEILDWLTSDFLIWAFLTFGLLGFGLADFVILDLAVPRRGC